MAAEWMERAREHAAWITAVGACFGLVGGWVSWLFLRGVAMGKLRAEYEARISGAVASATSATSEARAALAAIDDLRRDLGEHMAGTATVEARLLALEGGQQAIRETIARLGTDVRWLRDVGGALLASAPHLPGALAALAHANSSARDIEPLR